jgi:ribonuclease P protein component
VVSGGKSRLAGQPAPDSRRFPKSAHLLKHADFDRVYREGKRHFSRSMTFFYLRRDAPGPAGARVGFTVGRVLGGAVDRNRMRRRLREAVRSKLNALTAAVDVVINPKKSVLTSEFPGLVSEVERAFQVIQSNAAGDKSSRQPKDSDRGTI